MPPSDPPDHPVVVLVANPTLRPYDAQWRCTTGGYYVRPDQEEHLKSAGAVKSRRGREGPPRPIEHVSAPTLVEFIRRLNDCGYSVRIDPPPPKRPTDPVSTVARD